MPVVLEPVEDQLEIDGSSRLWASVLATAEDPRGPVVLGGKYLCKYYPHLIAQAADSQLIERA